MTADAAMIALFSIAGTAFALHVGPRARKLFFSNGQKAVAGEVSKLHAEVQSRYPVILGELHKAETGAEALAKHVSDAVRAEVATLLRHNPHHLAQGKALVGQVETNITAGVHKLLSDLNQANTDKQALQDQVNNLAQQLADQQTAHANAIAALQSQLDAANQTHAEFVAGLNSVVPQG